MKPLNVAIADDVEGIRGLVTLWLQGLGHTVVSVATGNELSKLLKSQRFDLVITDIIMPDGDGLEAILALKKTDPSVRILAMSGGGTYLRAVDCLKVAKGIGAHAVLLKPFNRDRLLEAVGHALPSRDTIVS